MCLCESHVSYEILCIVLRIVDCVVLGVSPAVAIRC